MKFNFLLLSQRIFSDRKFIEHIGKCISTSGISFIILLDGRPYLIELGYELPIDCSTITDPHLLNLLEKNSYGVIGKRMVSFFGEANIASVAFLGNHKSILSHHNSFYQFNQKFISELLSNKIVPIITPIISEENQRHFCSPIQFLSNLNQSEIEVYYCDIQLPPYGISKKSELQVWSETEEEMQSSFEWLKEWNPEMLPLHFLSFQELRQLSQLTSTLTILT